MKQFYLLLMMAMLINSCKKERVFTMEDINILPQPTYMEIVPGAFHLNSKTIIYVIPLDQDFKDAAEFLHEKIIKSTGFDLKIEDLKGKPEDNAIILTYIKNLENEAYRLFSDKNSIKIEASNGTGLFYGIQTLRQLLPIEFESNEIVKNIDWIVPAVNIIDQPKFKWRGMLLDCCRHFMDKEFVMRYIDLLAYHKMNTLHWHLTEDQGWRIEIKQYPELTEVGAWRTEQDGSKYGGFYTQKDIQEIVEYAQKMHVNIVPEIELPGHSSAAIASYAFLSCNQKKIPVETKWGVFDDIYCAGNDSVFTFLENVLDEVFGLFPYEYIHIGGDEAPKTRWENCDKCQARIKTENLENEHELQSYFIKRIEKYMNSKGKKLIGWDEILEGGLAETATVQSWRGVEGGIAAAKSGHDAIMSPTSHCYFDYDIKTIDLKKVYSFDPIPDSLTEDEQQFILGGECNMWTERAPQDTVDGKVFPRILAMSEVLWTYPQVRDYEKFKIKLQTHYKRLDLMGVRYGKEEADLEE